MTAAAVEPTISPRCTDGEHNRCPGILPGAFCGCRCGHPATVNVRAAGAVVLHDRQTYVDDRMFHAHARELLDMLGLVDGRQIVADDVRSNNLGGAHQATGGSADERPLRLVDQDDDDLPRSKALTTPPGLAVLPPLAASPGPKPAAARKTSTKKRAARPRPAPAADDVAPAKAKRPRVAVCGTTGGYARHKRLKESVCDPCREAKNAYWRERDAARRVEQGQPPAPGRKRAAACGTRSGYMRHLRLNEPTCPACREANTQRQRTTSPEESRLLAAGVNPEAAAILGAAAPPTPTEGTASASPESDAAGTAPASAGHGNAGPDAQPQVSPSRSHSGEGEGAGASDAPAGPPATDDWLARAQRSTHRPVARAAALAIGLRLRIETATTAQLADGRLLARFDAALDDVSRAQARASSRSNGDT